MNIIKIALALGLVAAATSANASNTSAGYVSGISAMANGAVLFNHSGSRTTPPSCGAGQSTRWAFDGTSAAGQAKLALLMSAYALHKQVTVVGTQSCPNWADTESVEFPGDRQ